MNLKAVHFISQEDLNIPKEYPQWVCFPCGMKYGYRAPGVSTWHNNTCGVCGEHRQVTEPRDFGHLDTKKLEGQKI